MTRKLQTATLIDVQLVDQALINLRTARDLLAEANCPMALKKVRRALKSAEGARRHVERRSCETPNSTLT